MCGIGKSMTTELNLMTKKILLLPLSSRFVCNNHLRVEGGEEKVWIHWAEAGATWGNGNFVSETKSSLTTENFHIFLFAHRRTLKFVLFVFFTFSEEKRFPHRLRSCKYWLDEFIMKKARGLTGVASAQHRQVFAHVRRTFRVEKIWGNVVHLHWEWNGNLIKYLLKILLHSARLPALVC